MLQHLTYPAHRMCEELLEEGIGFDGSSIRGFTHINESDMLLKPDIETAIMDPACGISTMSVLCDVWEPVKKERYDRDPRYVANRAEEHLKTTGIADTAYFGPELEFFVFDSVRFDQNSNSGFYYIDSDEGIWNSGNNVNGQNHGHRPRHKEGYFPVPPTDSLQDFRSRCVMELKKAGIECEVHHHEVATAGQCEIGMRFQSLSRMADQTMMYKYILKNTARAAGKTLTFMPKPLFGDNGTGMHVHQSLSKNGQNVFYDKDGYGLLSETALYYIGGLLEHSPALLALTSPSTNSYRRLVPGFEAPVNAVYSLRNRSAAVRIPTTCNPYLAFSAMLMAGLDGIKRKIHPGEPADMDLFELPKAEAAKIPTVPGSLEEALESLASDNDFLLQGGVFSKDLIDTWIEYKYKKEIDYIRLRPHPSEFYLYFDT